MKGKEWAIEKIRRQVTLARKQAEKELLIHPEYGKEIMNQIMQLKFDKQQEKIDRLRSMQ